MIESRLEEIVACPRSPNLERLSSSVSSSQENAPFSPPPVLGHLLWGKPAAILGEHSSSPVEPGLRSRQFTADSVPVVAAAAAPAAPPAPASRSGSPARDFPQRLGWATRSLGASARTAPRVGTTPRLGLSCAPLPRRARGRGGCGSGARHVSEPAAALLRPAAEGRARPAPPARPGPAQPVVPAGGRPPAHVSPAPGSGLSGRGRGEIVLPDSNHPKAQLGKDMTSSKGCRVILLKLSNIKLVVCRA